MSSDSKGEPNFYDNKQEFWKKYRTGRPIIPASFYQRFYDYHASHGGSFGTVQDVGAGFGEMSLELSKKFSHVIVTDPAPQSLNVAQDLIRSKAASDASRFSFRQERIEESDLPEGSVDAIFSSTALHWMEPEKAVPMMVRQLKPGGTLFISLNGVPRYNHPKIQQLWWDILRISLEGAAARSPSSELIVRRSSAIGDTAYDCVALPESDFEPGVIRLKLNALGDHDAFVFVPQIAGDFVYESRIGPSDRLEEGVDRDWFFEVDAEDIRAKMASYPFDPDPQMLEEHLSEIEKLLDGGKCEGRWPVSIIMATKRKQT